MAQHEVYKRFYVCDQPLLLAGIDGIVEYHGRLFKGGKWCYYVQGHLDSLTSLNNPAGGVRMLTSLNAPATTLPQAALDFLALQGVVPAPGDTVLNVLRAWRTVSGETASFDISAKE